MIFQNATDWTDLWPLTKLEEIEIQNQVLPQEMQINEKNSI